MAKPIYFSSNSVIKYSKENQTAALYTMLDSSITQNWILVYFLSTSGGKQVILNNSLWLPIYESKSLISVGFQL